MSKDKVTEKDYYSVPKVSNTSIGWFQISPQYFKKKLDKELKDQDQKFFELGRQVHMFILERNEFNKLYTYLEFDTPKSKQQIQFAEEVAGGKDIVDAYNSQYKATKNAEEKALELSTKLERYIEYVKIRKDYKDVLSWSKWSTITGANKAVVAHKKANELVYNDELFSTKDVETYNELPIFWNYPGYNLECKSMLDRLVIDHKNKTIKLIDLKTTSHLHSFGKSIKAFKYDRQFAFYWMAIFYWWMKNHPDKNIDEYSEETYVVGIQTRDLIEVKVFKIEDRLLNNGMVEIAETIPEIAWHFEENKWEYTKKYYQGDGIETINMEDYNG